MLFGTGSYPITFVKGVQRKIRFVPIALPLITPNLSIASKKYEEHVG